MLINVKSHSYHSIIFVHSWLQIKKIRFDKKNSSQFSSEVEKTNHKFSQKTVFIRFFQSVRNRTQKGS